MFQELLFKKFLNLKVIFSLGQSGIVSTKTRGFHILVWTNRVSGLENLC